MKSEISARNMKAHLQTALNKHNPKRKIPDRMAGHDTSYLYHPKINEKIQSHIGTMIFSKTKLGVRFWKTTIDKALNSNLEIEQIIDTQLKQIAKNNEIPLAKAKQQLIEDLIQSEKRYNKFNQELSTLRNLNKSTLTNTTDNAYRNNAQFFHIIIQLAKKAYIK
jgi:antitoxin component of RelBE/YafQ-DinJ toxin-antitoxin module